MNNEEFKFFLHGTTISDSSMINNIFNSGLLNYRANDMLSTMWPVNIGNNFGELGTVVKNYSGTKGNAVFVIKIPKYYLTPKVINGQLVQIPLPIWKSIIDEHSNEISQLAPELIYGVYLSEKDSFIPNPNYSEVHNPVGLKFDNQQISYLLNEGVIEWHNFAVERRSKSYEELEQYDIDNDIWGEAIQQYKNHFGIVKSENPHI